MSRIIVGRPPRDVMTAGRLLEASFERIVRYAAMAPSLHNTQPWRFRLAGSQLELRADVTRHLTATDPDGRQLLISCGAALLGARLAVRSLGREERVTLLPDEGDVDLLARLSVGEPSRCTERDARLLAALPRRRTVRGGFLDAEVDGKLLVDLQRAAAAEGARLYLLEHPGHRRAVTELVAAAERAQRAHPDVQRELHAWTPAQGQARPDGVPSWSYPTSTGAAGPQELAPRDFDADRRWGQLAAPGPAGPGLVAVLLTPADTRRDWLVAGSALLAVLATAAAADMQASLHSQPIGLSGLRSLIADEVAVGEQPQMLLQLGHAEPGPATPRRAPADVTDAAVAEPLGR